MTPEVRAQRTQRLFRNHLKWRVLGAQDRLGPYTPAQMHQWVQQNVRLAGEQGCGRMCMCVLRGPGGGSGAWSCAEMECRYTKRTQWLFKKHLQGRVWGPWIVWGQYTPAQMCQWVEQNAKLAGELGCGGNYMCCVRPFECMHGSQVPAAKC